MRKIHEDFERKVCIGSDNIEEAIGKLDLMIETPSEKIVKIYNK